MEQIENQTVTLTDSQRELLSGVCHFYGKTQYIQFVLTKKSLIKALDAIIGDLEFKLLITQPRYHSILVTDIEALQLLYSQLV